MTTTTVTIVVMFVTLLAMAGGAGAETADAAADATCEPVYIGSDGRPYVNPDCVIPPPKAATNTS